MNQRPSHSARFASGFTLLELLLVLAVISVLAAIILVAINPAKQISVANNTQRQRDVATILHAIDQYAADHHGALPSSITTTAQEICQTNSAVTSTCADLSVLTDNQQYLSLLPSDPTESNEEVTGYDVVKSTDATPIVTVSAPYAELGATITASK